MAEKKNPRGGVDTPELRALLRTVVALGSAEEARRFFVDLCTPSELAALADRWRVAGLVAREVPYRAIAEQTGVSTATITRVARAITYGEGGYRRALAKTSRKGKTA